MREDYVLLFMVRSDGRFLLQHRDHDAPTYPDYWGFFGGAIEAGESPIEALRREAQEELRYDPGVLPVSLSSDYDDPVTRRFGKKHYFIERIQGHPLLELQEGQGMEWLTLEDCEGLPINGYNREKIRELLSIVQRADADDGFG